MKLFFELSEMLAGVGFFLLGMNFIEETLKSLAGRSFKIFLRKQTKNKLKAVAGGAILTGILQSSSVVNLMVLAFVGSGILNMQNALAVMLGSNVGTTLTSWIVATLGFSFQIQNFAFPLLGLSGIVMAIFRHGKVHLWSKFLFGFSALFVGLSFIKTGFEELATQFDFSVFTSYPAVFFVMVGFVLTSLVQSSSTTVAITLSALYANAISLHAAMAVVLGSEVGTTIKLLLASFNGIPAKKQVAFGNFIYNSFVIVLFLLLLSPVEKLITSIIGVKDNLTALVFFQSGINVAGLIVFFPFLKIFSDFLEHRFKTDHSGTKYIHLVPAAEGELAVDALNKEARDFIDKTILYLLEAVDQSAKQSEKSTRNTYSNSSTEEKYDYLKQLYGEMHEYYVLINKELLSKEEKERIEQIISSVRNTMFAAKSMKDSLPDIKQFKNSSNDLKFNHYLETRDEVLEYCTELNRILNSVKHENAFEVIVQIYNGLQRGYTERLGRLYEEKDVRLNEIEISTLINFNRELHSTYKALIWAVKDYLLDKKQSEYFSELPGFIR